MSDFSLFLFSLSSLSVLAPIHHYPPSALYLTFFLPCLCLSSLTPCSWRRWTSRRSTGSTTPTSQLSRACGPTQGSRRPTTAAESTSSLTPLNSTSLSVCDLCLVFKNGICVTVWHNVWVCLCNNYEDMSVILFWENIPMYAVLWL